MSPLRGVTLAGLAKKYPKNGGVKKANSIYKSLQLHSVSNEMFDYKK
jgi:hypothetical protein